MAMLVAVLAFGRSGQVQRWLDLGIVRFQPSELVKLAVPLMIAWYLAEKRLPPSWQRLAIAAVLIVAPVLLIAKQPTWAPQCWWPVPAYSCCSWQVSAGSSSVA